MPLHAVQPTSHDYFSPPLTRLRPQRLTTEEIDALDVEEDSSLISNPEQREVVAAIVTAPGGSVPFMIFGPPGTGKTVTVVKAALQVLKSNPDARLLMCAPTNEAADLLAFKMAELGPTQLLRLNAVKRPVESESTLQAALKQFSIFGADGAYTIPDAVHLQSRRVVVTTCVSAAMPYCLGVEPGWFTHIFIDEAGQCVEPEAMIPVKLLAGENTNVVLAGDVKQLGPVIHSDYSRDLGLKQSYMERLSNMPVYDWKLIEEIVKLVKHFRSHPAIISFSNKKFYGDELEPCSDEAITHGMLHSVVLDGLNPKFPVVFHGISGQEKHEEDTPSYINAQEASLVVRYCKALVNDPRARISAKDIGVVSPYNGQCRMIRTLLQRSSRQMDGLRVGPTEAFQGQDRRVIIISTVRSNRFLADIRQRLGFVADPQRLNVAITRARALLIVIGDPDVLALDDVWREFMAYVKANGGWRGKGVSEAHIYGPNAEDTTTAAVRRIDEQINEV
ncbi:P-loop containing nucleoside triphosphate hydrolase protein [Fomitopsis serialis]|uniref:P-loop containing nucleoside triphosphate hydrolase protein n=1 Tax=Fomitopsis serialis TaxID=139415 RepID=UPI0020089EAC|nr:P-loop containing nucleoside triphosphate hydrolase protein [Neoantrodia serialis]KAH9925152.1 P-loop containing nucleoside triphosphate hydrolase protein [Neoantrodia serialis]